MAEPTARELIETMKKLVEQGRRLIEDAKEPRKRMSD